MKPNFVQFGSWNCSSSTSPCVFCTRVYQLSTMPNTPRSCDDDCPECEVKDNSPILQQPTAKALDKARGTSDYCKICPKGLTVGASTVPEMGQGVLATKAIKKGTILGYYQGNNIKEHGDCEYDFNIGKKYVVCSDDETTSNWSRFVNHHDRDHINADFHYHFIPRMRTLKSGGDPKWDAWCAAWRRVEVFIRLNKDVKKGEEIFVDYGPEYNDQLRAAGFTETTSEPKRYSKAERALYKATKGYRGK